MNTSDNTSNETLTCAARNIQGPVELSHPVLVSLTIRCLLILYYMYTGFFGVFLNIFVIYLVCKFKSLRTTEFVFATQIVAVGAMRSIFLLPLQMVSAMVNQWLFGAYMCAIVGDVSFNLGTLRAGLMLAFVSDRFLNVFAPYTYPRYRVRVLVAKHVVIYTNAALCTVLYAVFDCESFSVSTWTCRYNVDCSRQCSILGAVYFWTYFLPCNMLPIVLYLVLFRKAKREAETMRPPATASTDPGEHTTAERERVVRATITFSLMFFALFLATFPPTILLALIDIVDPLATSENTLWYYIMESLALNTFILSSIADPIFILRNRDVKEALPKVTWLPPYLYCSCNTEEQQQQASATAR